MRRCTAWPEHSNSRYEIVEVLRFLYDFRIDNIGYTYYIKGMTENKTLNTKEVAALLGCHQATVPDLVKRGHFPNARKFDPTRNNSPLRIPIEVVLAYQEKQLVSPKTDL